MVINMDYPEDELYDYKPDDSEYLSHPIVNDEGEIISRQDFIEKYKL